MIHAGHNEIDGIAVEVVRKRIRRISIRVAADGMVLLSVPKWGATLRAGETFLREKWAWVLKTRAATLARPAAARAPVTEADLVALRTLLDGLNAAWSARVGEPGVAWRIRRLKSVWGCCHWRDRYITYNAELAHAPRELVEYVVVHEYTHFAVHDHGPRFCALMDERLPGWRLLRRRLNRRDWGETYQDLPDLPRDAPGAGDAPMVSPPAFCTLAAPVSQTDATVCKPTLVQTEFWE